MSFAAELNKSVLQAVNKQDSFYRAFLSDQDGIAKDTINAPSDYNSGAIANILEYTAHFARMVQETEFEKTVDPYLDALIYFFSGIKRLSGESDIDLRNRFDAIMLRNRNFRRSRFLSIEDMITAFSYFFSNVTVHLLNCAVQSNLVNNSDFESPIANEWVSEPANNGRTNSFSFWGSYSFDMTKSASLAQTITIPKTDLYVINFFVLPSTLLGQGLGYSDQDYSDQTYFTDEIGPGAPVENVNINFVDVEITKGSEYWNFDSHSWQSGSPVPVAVNLKSISWNHYTLKFEAEKDDIVSVKFLKKINFFIDRIELGVWEYPCFDIVVSDTRAPVFSDFLDSAYADHSYAYGSYTGRYGDDYFQDMLDIIRPAGVRGRFFRQTKVQ